MLNIFIFCNPIHSGKSTSLLSWTKQQKNISGILMPEINGKKWFYDIELKKYFEAEVDLNTTNDKTQSIGKYYFIDASFHKANQIIIDCFKNESELIIIDEIGKLELRKEGFFESLQFILQSSFPKKNLSLLIVVRDTLLVEVVTLFKIKNYHLILHSDEFNKLIH